MTKQEFISALENILEFESKRLDELDEYLTSVIYSERVKFEHRKMRYSHIYAYDLVNDIIELAKKMEE